MTLHGPQGAGLGKSVLWFPIQPLETAQRHPGLLPGWLCDLGQTLTVCLAQVEEQGCEL